MRKTIRLFLMLFLVLFIFSCTCEGQSACEHKCEQEHQKCVEKYGEDHSSCKNDKAKCDYECLCYV